MNHSRLTQAEAERMQREGPAAFAQQAPEPDWFAPPASGFVADVAESLAALPASVVNDFNIAAVPAATFDAFQELAQPLYLAANIGQRGVAEVVNYSNFLNPMRVQRQAAVDEEDAFFSADEEVDANSRTPISLTPRRLSVA